MIPVGRSSRRSSRSGCTSQPRFRGSQSSRGRLGPMVEMDLASRTSPADLLRQIPGESKAFESIRLQGIALQVADNERSREFREASISGLRQQGRIAPLVRLARETRQPRHEAAVGRRRRRHAVPPCLLQRARFGERAALEASDAAGTKPWYERANQELRASGETIRRRAPETRDDLSPQELQIALLAAEGLTNREIGARLFVSHRTVGSHLYRIFPKLSITSRAELREAMSQFASGSRCQNGGKGPERNNRPWT